MVMTGDLAANWRKFRNNYETFMIATGANKKAVEVQAAVLTHCMGEEVRSILDTLDISAEQKQDPKYILEVLQQYFIPKTNISIERHRFNSRTQDDNEKFDSFVGDLRKIANNCEFGSMKDALIKDRIVCGIRDIKIKDRLLREVDLNLDKAIKICKAAEETDNHIRKLGDQTKMQVGEIKKSTDRKYVAEKERTGTSARGRRVNTHYNSANNKRTVHGTDRRYQGHTREENTRNMQVDCGRCGRSHDHNRCPAYGKSCKKCGKLNHFAIKCKSRIVNSINDNKVEPDSYVLANIKIIVDTIENDWFQDIQFVNINKEISFKLDTGAQINVLPLHVYKQLNIKTKLENIKINVTNYGGSKLLVIGACKYDVICNNVLYKSVSFVVIETDSKSVPVLGINSIKTLNLLKRVEQRQIINEISCENVVSKYDNVFKGIGKITTEPCQFKVKQNYQAEIVPCRKVPYQLMDKLKIELQKMTNDGIKLYRVGKYLTRITSYKK
ncbi:hypothetical protein QE152_g6141 [Popillia japonica]|uniref:CCHC-type domain-containing protein n=1 Tax=Popillia japonica TaxID=7064 RepID=A0AAW1MIX5_POPJA